jgi:triosephosphate isomerase (TIM)
MNGSLAANAERWCGLLAACGPRAADVAVCVPTPYLAQLRPCWPGSAIGAGARRTFGHEQGAYTGEVSAAMLREFGCRYVIVGHSERRAVPRRKRRTGGRQGAGARWRKASRPSSASARRWPSARPARPKRGQAPAVGRDPHGGALQQRDRGGLRAGVGHRHRQDRQPEQAQAVHAVLRAQLQAATAACRRMPHPLRRQHEGRQRRQLLAQPDIDGGLIGGASLKAADFWPSAAPPAEARTLFSGVHLNEHWIDHPAGRADCCPRWP